MHAWEKVRVALSCCRLEQSFIEHDDNNPRLTLISRPTGGVACSVRRTMNTSLTVPGQSPPQRGGALWFGLWTRLPARRTKHGSPIQDRGETVPLQGLRRMADGNEVDTEVGVGRRRAEQERRTTNTLPSSNFSETNSSLPASFGISDEGTPAPSMNGGNKTWEEVRASTSFPFKNCHFR